MKRIFLLLIVCISFLDNAQQGIIEPVKWDSKVEMLPDNFNMHYHDLLKTQRFTLTKEIKTFKFLEFLLMLDVIDGSIQFY